MGNGIKISLYQHRIFIRSLTDGVDLQAGLSEHGLLFEHLFRLEIFHLEPFMLHFEKNTVLASFSFSHVADLRD